MFYTKFDLPAKVLREYDPHDNVDRLSYVDSTKQIVRFMQSGYKLRMSRAQALYNDYEELHGEDPVLASPVYAEDMALMSARLKHLKDYAASKSGSNVEKK